MYSQKSLALLVAGIVISQTIYTGNNKVSQSLVRNESGLSNQAFYKYTNCPKWLNYLESEFGITMEKNKFNNYTNEFVLDISKLRSILYQTNKNLKGEDEQ